MYIVNIFSYHYSVSYILFFIH